MKSSGETMPTATYEGGFVSVSFNDGALIRFPVSGNRRLAAGTPAQLPNLQVTRFGLHRPPPAEDLPLAGLARGDYGQFADRSLDRYPESEVPPLSVAEPGPPPIKA